MGVQQKFCATGLSLGTQPAAVGHGFARCSTSDGAHGDITSTHCIESRAGQAVRRSGRCTEDVVRAAVTSTA